jgi:hypothetical protein
MTPVASLCGPTCGGQLFVHVIGAITLFGSVLAVTVLAYAALRVTPEQAQLLRRVGFWMTLVLTVPAWIVMYGGGAWVLDREFPDQSPGWVDAGLDIAHVAAVLTLLLLVLGWFAIRRPRLGGWFVGVATLYLVALAVAWFYMSAKP